MLKYTVTKILATSSLDKILKLDNRFMKKGGKKSIVYYNGGCCFDCETSNTVINGDKIGFMYIWQLCINDVVIYGRTWEEFIEFMNRLSIEYELDVNKRIIVFIHNAPFDFQFIRKLFTWSKVFAIEKYKPLYAISENGFEFRCSYQLSGLSLSKVAEQLQFHDIKKLVGNLDYDKVRHSKTPLTKEELEYCFNDVIIGQYYIDEQIQQYGGLIWKLPLTNTGRVRNYCREHCLYKNNKDGRMTLNMKYKNLISSLTIDPEEYPMLKSAFQGGFTHANVFYTGKTLENVKSFDFTSSYPAVMMCEQYPMSKGEKITVSSIEELESLMKDNCLIFKVKYNNIRQKETVYENYISFSKCQAVKPLINNGRIVSAESLITNITEIDYKVIKAFYDYDSIQLGTIWKYRKGRLPADFLKCVLSLYNDKTTLKDVTESVVEYMLKKGMLNSTYGMTVTDIVRDIIELADNWENYDSDLEEVISKYNNTFTRFLYYPWGVYITAYARRNLFTAIYSVGKDYVYSDTDSIKLLNYEEHKEYFEHYNELCERKMKTAMMYLGVDLEAYAPKTIKGVRKPLGVWDDDGFYNKFKTLGAKRYLTLDSKGYHLTLAGLPKKKGVEAILKQADSKHLDPFEVFNIGFKVKAKDTGKMTHTYCDEEVEGEVTDYLGNVGHYHELSYIYLEKAPFEMSISADYAEYIKLVMNKAVGLC